MTDNQLHHWQQLDELISAEYAKLLRAEDEIRQYTRLAQLAERKHASILERIKALKKEKADWRTEIFDTREDL